MRTAVCLIAAVLNALLAVALTGMTFDPETPLPMKAGFGVVGLAVWLTAGALAAGPFVQVPATVVTGVRAWCVALPILYFVASLDHGTLSGQEFLLGLFVAGFSWATWRVFVAAKLPKRAMQQGSAPV